MRLEREDGTSVDGSVWAVLTPEEAFMLKEALIIYFEDDPPDPGWHHHFGQGDEGLTIAVELLPQSVV